MSLVENATLSNSYDHFIAGEPRPSIDGGTFDSINPTTGQPWARVADGTHADINAAVEAVRRLWIGESGRLSSTRRGRLLMRLADAISERADALAAVETKDNGKLLKEMDAQLRVIPDWLYYFGGQADKIEGRVVPLDRTSVFNYTLRERLGVIGVITPWNSPLLLTFMAAAPALAAGNTMVFKPSEITPASIGEVARLTADVGIPPGVFNVVAGGRETGVALTEHPDVAKIVFTGGVEGGKAVGRAVGGRLGRYLLELGGKSANIVFDDADMDAAEAGVLAGIYAAGGQTCIAGSRLFVHASVFDEFLDRLAKRARAIRIGDPVAAETQMGPMATTQQLQRVESFVRDAREGGANVVAGGERAELEQLPGGYFFQPTLLTGVDP